MDLIERGQPVTRISNSIHESLHDYEDAIQGVETSNSMCAIVESLMRGLAWREQEVLERRFGFGEQEPQTLEEIGRVFGVTRERIRQIEARALEKMQRKVHRSLAARSQPDSN